MELDYPILLDYICGDALMQNLSHKNFANYHDEKLHEKIM